MYLNASHTHGRRQSCWCIKWWMRKHKTSSLIQWIFILLKVSPFLLKWQFWQLKLLLRKSCSCYGGNCPEHCPFRLQLQTLLTVPMLTLDRICSLTLSLVVTMSEKASSLTCLNTKTSKCFNENLDFHKMALAQNALQRSHRSSWVTVIIIFFHSHSRTKIRVGPWHLPIYFGKIIWN